MMSQLYIHVYVYVLLYELNIRIQILDRLRFYINLCWPTAKEVNDKKRENADEEVKNK